MNTIPMLAGFARVVRTSTIKRFRAVAPGDEQWRPAQHLLSFADHLRHLKEADRWLLDMLTGKLRPRSEIRPSDAEGDDWDRLFAEFLTIGEEKVKFIESMAPDDLENPIQEEVLGETTWWWLIASANLDHEAHHRGALQLALRLRYGDDLRTRR